MYAGLDTDKYKYPIGAFDKQTVLLRYSFAIAYKKFNAARGKKQILICFQAQVVSPSTTAEHT